TADDISGIMHTNIYLSVRYRGGPKEKQICPILQIWFQCTEDENSGTKMIGGMGRWKAVATAAMIHDHAHIPGHCRVLARAKPWYPILDIRAAELVCYRN